MTNKTSLYVATLPEPTLATYANVLTDTEKASLIKELLQSVLVPGDCSIRHISLGMLTSSCINLDYIFEEKAQLPGVWSCRPVILSCEGMSSWLYGIKNFITEPRMFRVFVSDKNKITLTLRKIHSIEDYHAHQVLNLILYKLVPHIKNTSNRNNKTDYLFLAKRITKVLFEGTPVRSCKGTYVIEYLVRNMCSDLTRHTHYLGAFSRLHDLLASEARDEGYYGTSIGELFYFLYGNLVFDSAQAMEKWVDDRFELGAL